MKKRFLTLALALILLLGIARPLPVHAEEIPDVTQYSYEVVPVLAPFCYYLYVKTDNPDPTSFRLVDESSTLYGPDDYSSIRLPSGSPGLSYSTELDPGTYYAAMHKYPDVQYEDESIFRVPGGYIFTTEYAYSDGGSFRLLQKSYTGETILDDRFTETDVLVPCVPMTDRIGYLISTCTREDMTFFEKLDAVQARVDELAVYPRSVYNTDAPNTDRPYPLLAASPYPELSLNDHYDMYERMAHGMLAAQVYPFVLDSLGVPGTMGSVAQALEPGCQVSSGGTHAYVDVTFNGTTKSYGGAGAGGNDPLYSNRIQKAFTFRSGEDLAAGSPEDYRDFLLSFQAIAAEDLAHYRDLIAGDTYRSTIRKTGGTWIQVAVEGWGYGTSFSYIVPLGDNSAITVSDVWVDGRYIGVHETIQLRETFEDHPAADIIVQDVTYTDRHGVTHTQDVLYSYDPDMDAWTAPWFYNGDTWYNPNWVLPEELILTRAEVEAMDIDGKSSRWPESCLIYDGTAYPGTPREIAIVTGIRVPETMDLVLNETATISAQVIPEDALDSRVTWTSSDPKVVEVTDPASGSIKAVGEGTATLTVVTNDGGYSASCLVTVRDACRDGHTFTDYHSNNDATCTQDGTKTAKCAYCDATNTIADPGTAHHVYDRYPDRCSVCGATNPDYYSVVRIYGETRYETSFKIADELKAVLGVEKFQNIIVASGTSFADALSGSYLAARKNAPILLVSTKTEKAVKDYIRENLTPGGTVYLLGGTAAVPESREQGLQNFTVKRLGGATRYDTNLLILKEAGPLPGQVLVCTGNGFADSLSASATGKPILLVKDNLTSAQKELVFDSMRGFYIIGGEKAVSKSVERTLGMYGLVERISGNTRYETSVAVAKRFCYGPQNAVLAYAQNFPDGLSGGPLACALQAPLILTDSNKPTAACTYMNQHLIYGGYVTGGPGLISDKTVRQAFSMPEDKTLTAK